MAYLGSTPNYGFLEGQTVTFNGSTTQVTLNRAISTPDAIDVFIDNVHQEPDVAYTVDAGGGSITFTGTPVNGAVCYIRFHGQKFDTAQASQVIDSDGDTHVKVEASSDSDTVVITAGGTVAITANSSGVTIPNLTVTGTTTSVNSTNLNIGDNQITLNSDVTGTPSENAGLIVNRGSASDVSFLWNETSDYWIVNEPLVSATRINAIVSGNTPSLDGDNIGLFQNSASSQNAIVSIISNSSSYSQLNFGDENDENAGYLRYNNSSDLFTLNSPITISGALTANSGINIDNITIDGQEIDVSSGDLTIDVAGNIHIDANGGSILLKDDGTQFGLIAKVSDGLGIYASVADKDIFFKGTDGTSAITALQLDMSDAGTAIFNSQIQAPSGAVSAPTFAFSNDTDTGISRPTTNTLNLVTNATERMRIDSSGNVGIGTTSPDQPLDIAYTNNTAYSVDNFTNSNNSGLRIENTSTTANAFSNLTFRVGSGADLFFGIEQKSANDGDFIFANQNSPDIEMMRITSGGNVGIGTNSPSEKLHVQGDGADILITDAGGGETAKLGSTGSNHGILELKNSSHSSQVFFNSSGSSYLNGGNVGIGTTSPTSLLHVSGDAKANRIIGNALMESSSGFSSQIFAVVGGTTSNQSTKHGGVFFSKHADSNALLVGQHDTAFNSFVVKGDGRVAIGSTSITASADFDDLQIGSNGGTSGLTILSSGSATAGIAFADPAESVAHSLVCHHADNSMRFNVHGNTERMRIDDNGNVGIGESNPTQYYSGANQLVVRDGTANAGITIRTGTSGAGMLAFADGATTAPQQYAGYIQYVHGSNMSFGTENTERMRIHSNGNLALGTTDNTAKFKIFSHLQSYNGLQIQNGTNNTGGLFVSFRRSSNVTIGSISQGGGGNTVTYNTSSDYRLKENVSYSWDATTRLKKLKPARFNWISDDTNTLEDGFLAHEAQAVVPECVTGTHNEVDDDGNAVMQGIDQSKLIPLLVKTIQELEARITTLENA